MAEKSSREIEQELESKRADLHATIDEALDRMTLEGAWNYAGRYLRDNGGGYGQSLGNVIKEKPLAVGLVAVGMAWILFGSSVSERRQGDQDRNLRQRDRDGDPTTRARLATGEGQKPGPQSLAGAMARPDAVAPPADTPSSARSSATQTTTGAGKSRSSATQHTPASAAPPPVGSTETPDGTRDRQQKGGGSEPAAPGVIPSKGPSSLDRTPSTTRADERTTARSGGSKGAGKASSLDPKSSRL